MCGGCVGCVAGFWMEQAHADEPSVVIDALDDVSVQLELGHDCGREVNPAGVQLDKSNRPAAGLAQALQQPLLLGVSERHRRIVVLQRDCGRLERFQATLLALDVWRLGVCLTPTAASPPQSTPALCDRGRWPGGVASLDAEAQVARIAWRSRRVGAVRLLRAAGANL